MKTSSFLRWLRAAVACAAVVVGIFALSASAATHYVSTTGNDGGAGTVVSPWRTITHAIRAGATCEGDEILVAGGLYEESITNNAASGGKERLTFKGGYKSDWTRDLKNCPSIIKPPVNTVPCWYIENAVSNRVSGFVLTGGSYGIVPRGRTTKSSAGKQNVFYTFVSQLVVTNNVSGGILIAGVPPGNYQYADDCVISSSYVANNSGYGIYVRVDQICYYWIVNCTVVNNSSGGFYSSYATQRVLALNSIFSNNKNGTRDFYADNNSSFSAVERSFVGTLYASLGFAADTGMPGNGNRPLGGVFHDDPGLAADGSLRADSKCVKAGLDVRTYSYIGASGMVDADLYGEPWNGEYDIGAVKSSGANQRGFAASQDVYVAQGGDDTAAGTEEAPVATLEEGLYRTAAGGTCHVGAGEWESQASLFLDGQKLKGAGKDSTYLSALQKGEPAVLIGASDVSVSDMTIRNSPMGVQHAVLYAARTNATISAVNFVNCTNGIFKVEMHGQVRGQTVARRYQAAFAAVGCAFLDGGRGIFSNNNGNGGYSESLTYSCRNCVFARNQYGILDNDYLPYQSYKCNSVVHSTFVSNSVYAAKYAIANYPGTIDHRNCIYKGVCGLYSQTMDNINLISCLFDCETNTVWLQNGKSYRSHDNTNTCLYGEAKIEATGVLPGHLLPGSPASRSGSSLVDFLGTDLTEDIEGSARDSNGIDIGAFVSPETKQILNPVKTYLVNVTGEPTTYGMPNPDYGVHTIEEGACEFAVTNGLVRYGDGVMAYPAGDGLRDVPKGYVYTSEGQSPQVGQETSFVADIQADATCAWSWEHQCQMIVDAGDGGSTVSVNGGEYAPAVTNWGVLGRSVTISFRVNPETEVFVGWADGDGGSPSDSTQFVHTVGQPVSFVAKRRLTHFVSTLGSDETGAGSPTKPWRTITHAILSDRTFDGDEIRVAGGLYEESVTNNVTKGGKHRLIFKGGYDGSWTRDLRNSPTTVKPPVNTLPCWYIENSASNRVSGFVFTGGKHGIVARGSSDQSSTKGDVRRICTVLAQLVVTNNVKNGILVCNDKDDNYVNGDECLIVSCLVASNGTYGIKPRLDAYKYMRVLNCTVFGNRGRGIGCDYSNNRVVVENCIAWGNGTYDMDSATTYGFSMARRCFIGTFNTAIDYNATAGLAASMNGLGISYNVNQPLEGVFHFDPGLNADGSLAADSRCVKAGLDLREHPWVGGEDAIVEDLYGTPWNGEYDLGAIKSAGANQRGFGASQDVYVAVDGDDEADGTEAAPVATVEEGLYRTAAGGTCHLGAGEWTSHASLFLPGQRLVGAGRDKTVLRPFAASEAVLNVGESDTRVSGITFRDAPLGLQIVPYLSASTNVTIDGCAFRNCTNGIFRLDGCQNSEGEVFIPAIAGSYKLGLELTGCVFTDCVRAYWFRAYRTVLDRVSNCVFAYNDYGIYDNVFADYNANHRRPVAHTTFVSNRTWAAYYSTSHYPGCISHYNNAYKGDKGVYVNAFDPITLYHCLFDCTLNTRWDRQDVNYRKYDSTNTSFSAFADVTLDRPMPGRPNAGSALLHAGGTLVPAFPADLAVDVEGRPRNLNPGHIDIGAYRAPLKGLIIFVR